jgi:hypothetical protein
VSVGDTVTYIDKDNVQNQFVVRHIEFTEFDKDLNFSYGGKRYSAKRGETNSTIITIDHTEPSMAKPRMNGSWQIPLLPVCQQRLKTLQSAI